MKKKSAKSINLWQSVIQTIYDIVKAHGGELKVETKEGQGSQFAMILPLYMKLKLLIVLLAMLPLGLRGQTNPLYVVSTKHEADSLRKQLQHVTNDTIRMDILRSLAGYIFWIKRGTRIGTGD